MALPRTFVGFSSSDISYYHLMCAWKAHDHIDFNVSFWEWEKIPRLQAKPLGWSSVSPPAQAGGLEETGAQGAVQECLGGAK